MIEAIIISLKLGFSFALWLTGIIIPIIIIIDIFKIGFTLIDWGNFLQGIIGLIMVIVGFILFISYVCFFFIYYIELLF